MLVCENKILPGIGAVNTVMSPPNALLARRVTLHGLTRTDLNGRTARVVSWHASGRANVRVEGIPKTLAIRPENLRLLEDMPMQTQEESHAARHSNAEDAPSLSATPHTCGTSESGSSACELAPSSPVRSLFTRDLELINKDAIVQVLSTDAYEAGAVLTTLPHATGISLAEIAASKEMGIVLSNMRHRFDQHEGLADSCMADRAGLSITPSRRLGFEDLRLAVLLMRLGAAPHAMCSSAPFIKQWLSSYSGVLVWGAELVPLLGVSGSIIVRSLRQEVTRLYQLVVEPTLDVCRNSFTPDADTSLSLHFIRAVALVLHWSPVARTRVSPETSAALLQMDGQRQSARAFATPELELLRRVPRDHPSINLEVITQGDGEDSQLVTTQALQPGTELALSAGACSWIDLYVARGSLGPIASEQGLDQTPFSWVNPNERLLVHLDPCLLPNADDELRWKVVHECAGYHGPCQSDAHPSEMMCFELSGRKRFETDGSPPSSLVDLRRMIYLLVLATSEELHALLRGEELSIWAVDPTPSALESADERRALELQAIGRVLLMIFDMNIRMLDLAGSQSLSQSEIRTGHGQLIEDCAQLRKWERNELVYWRTAVSCAHRVSDGTSLDSLLDALGIDDGETAGELRLPIDRLMAAASIAEAPPVPVLSIDHAKGVQTHESTHDEMRQSKVRFNSLVVRQLLAKYDLDHQSSVQSILEFLSVNPDAPKLLSIRFGMSVEDARVVARYLRGQASDAAVDELMTAILALPDASVERTEVLILPGLLSDLEIKAIFEAASSLGCADTPSTDVHVKDISAYPHHVRYGSSHVALFLHRDGFFQATFKDLSEKLKGAMRSQPTMYFTPQIELNFRCIEFHTYTAGNGLLTEGHRDQGSVLTMSILLSDPRDFKGGTFMTCDRADQRQRQRKGNFVLHHIERGDGILFHSEKMHNVAPIAAGVRHALVIELWLLHTNTKDRHS